VEETKTETKVVIKDGPKPEPEIKPWEPKVTVETKIEPPKEGR
jgi:hypothetical protein